MQYDQRNREHALFIFKLCLKVLGIEVTLHTNPNMRQSTVTLTVPFHLSFLPCSASLTRPFTVVNPHSAVRLLRAKHVFMNSDMSSRGLNASFYRCLIIQTFLQIFPIALSFNIPIY